jgi:hypothetical protein
MRTDGFMIEPARISVREPRQSKPRTAASREFLAGLPQADSGLRADLAERVDPDQRIGTGGAGGEVEPAQGTERLVGLVLVDGPVDASAQVGQCGWGGEHGGGDAVGIQHAGQLQHRPGQPLGAELVGVSHRQGEAGRDGVAVVVGQRVRLGQGLGQAPPLVRQLLPVAGAAHAFFGPVADVGGGLR